VNTLLAESIEAFVAGEWLFSFFENFAAHVDQLNFVKLIGLQEFPYTFRYKDDFSLSSDCLSDIKQFLQIIIQTVEFF